MKTMCKKLFSLLLVAVLLVSAIPFEADAASYVPVIFLDWDCTTVLYNGSAPVGGGCAAPTVKPRDDGQVLSHWEILTQTQSGNYIATGTAAQGTWESRGPGYGYWIDISGPTYLRAVYKNPDPAKRIVTFDANGGTVNETSRAVDHGTAIGELPIPTRTHYSFDGWYDANGGKYTKDSGVFGDVTLTARWNTGVYKVSFMEYDAGASEAQGKVVFKAWDVRNVSAQDAFERYNQVPDYNMTAVRPGHKITGWIYENGATFNPSAPVNSDVKVYPKYEAKTYTVTFQENWTYGTTVKKTVTYGQNINTFYYEPKASIDNSHFAFMGWYSSAGVKLDPTKTYTYDYDTEWFAAWDSAVNVQLWIYDKDNLDAPYTIIRNYYASTKTPTDLSKLKVSDFCSKAQEGTFSGWFTSYENMVSHAKGYGQQPLNSRTAYAGLVLHGYADITTTSNNNTNTNTGSGSNSTGNNYNSTSKQDPTNPATGDTAMIEVSVMVMTLAAAALVVMMQLRKRKMI